MAVVSQQVEDDNTHHSVGNTDDISRVNASKETDLKREMIRIYEGTSADDNNLGSRVSEAETELMIRIYKDTIHPMICADINRKQQKFLSTIREKFGLDLSAGMTWNLCNMGSTLGSQSLQLKFLNGILTEVSTGEIIEGNEQKPLLVALVDSISGRIVTTGAEATMEVELVVLEGESNNDEVDNWTSDEFDDNIINEWNGQKVLQGNTFVRLNEGIVSVDKISITHTSAWKEKRKCRMGARSVNAGFRGVKEALTESFTVTDKRNRLYRKHEIPLLSDPLYRVREISRRDGFRRLTKENMTTVMDLLTLHAINPQRLKDMLEVSPKRCKTIIEHASMCNDDKTKAIYLYRYPKDGQKINGVAFNISGQLVGIIAESCFVPGDNLPDIKRADAQKLIVSSTENWKEVVSFKDQDSFNNYLQLRQTLIPSSHNNLNVAIPQTIDPHNHTNLTLPTSTQSPKRPAASEHLISNSPKQPRYEHKELSPSMTSAGMDINMHCEAKNLESRLPDDDDDGDISMYLNLELRDKRWKIVWCAVGWISVILKLRKRMASCHHNTFIVIEASIEHEKTSD